ncbi:MAG: cyclase family protein [Suipraeoptans sp.]
MKIEKNQIVELSHKLYRRKENFPYDANCTVDSRMKSPSADPKNWYIESAATFAAHAGSHVEVPYHHIFGGKDCMTFPTENLVGECMVINCTGKNPGEEITIDDVMKAENEIKDGDIVFLYTGYDKYFRKENWQPYPPLSTEALDWLLKYHPKLIGTDASGIELTDGYDEEGRMHELYGEPIHVKCFENGIGIVESLTNLSEIEGLRTTVFVLGLPMQRMDASPARIIALKI